MQSELKPDSLFNELLNFYWLEPGTALHLYSLAKDIEQLDFKSPSIDISCGNGTFTFMALGGRWADSLKYYANYHGKLRAVEKDAFKDIIATPASHQFDYGTELVSSLLTEAEKTGHYKNLKLHNNNDENFPFPDDYFKTIYYNALYWVEDTSAMLGHLHRTLHPEGECLLHVMSHHQLSPFEEMQEYLDPHRVTELNRFNQNYFLKKQVLPTFYSHEQWCELFDNAGFEIVKMRSACANKAALWMMAIQFRPVMTELLELLYTADKDKTRELRHAWVTRYGELLYPLTQAGPSFSMEETPAAAYVLRKK